MATVVWLKDSKKKTQSRPKRSPLSRSFGDRAFKFSQWKGIWPARIRNSMVRQPKVARKNAKGTDPRGMYRRTSPIVPKMTRDKSIRERGERKVRSMETPSFTARL